MSETGQQPTLADCWTFGTLSGRCLIAGGVVCERRASENLHNFRHRAVPFLDACAVVYLSGAPDGMDGAP
jgi:hypothetical protein